MPGRHLHVDDAQRVLQHYQPPKLIALKVVFQVIDLFDSTLCIGLCIVSFNLCACAAFAVAIGFGKKPSIVSADRQLGFQANPDTRGTMNIVWTCLTAIFASVYLPLHFNIDDKLGDMIKTTTVYALAPEYMLSSAIEDFKRAWSGVQRMKGVRDCRGGEWTMKHAFFAEMAGFRLRDSREEYATPPILYTWMRNYDAVRTKDINAEEVDFAEFHEEIVDKSKRDLIVKTAACFQIATVLIETSLRRVESIYVTPLELLTCGYIICALATYVFWWHKPYGVRKRIVVHLFDGRRIRVNRNGWFAKSRRKIEGFVNSITATLGKFIEHKHVDHFITALFGIAFGAFHCAAWNSTFTNTNGQVLWRSCSCVLLIVPLLTITCELYGSDKVTNQTLNDTMKFIRFVLFNIYVIARVYLLILVALSFLSLPVDAYQEVRWSVFIPKFN